MHPGDDHKDVPIIHGGTCGHAEVSNLNVRMTQHGHELVSGIGHAFGMLAPFSDGGSEFTLDSGSFQSAAVTSQFAQVRALTRRLVRCWGRSLRRSTLMVCVTERLGELSLRSGRAGGRKTFINTTLLAKEKWPPLVDDVGVS